MIIDSHLHLSYLKRNKNFFDIKDKLLSLMKKNNIDYAIVIPDNISNSQCADMETIFKVIKNEKYLFSVGTINIFKNLNEQLLLLKKLFRLKKICGIKIFPGHNPFYPTDKRCNGVYKLCMKYGLPVIIHTGINSDNIICAKYNDPKYIIKIAKQYPKLNIVIAHYFWPKMDYCYELTKDFKNIFYDTSAIADSEVLKVSGGRKKVLKILEKTISLKPDNVIFGTDWPICSINKHIKLVKALNISQETKRKIFFQNAVRLFKLSIL